MFKFLLQRPYVQCALVLAIGTALGAAYPPPLALIIGDWWLWGVLGIALGALWLSLHLQRRTLAPLPGFLLLALIGLVNASLAVHAPRTQQLRAYVDVHAEPGRSTPQLRLEGRVASLPKYKNGHLRFMLEVERLRPWLDIPREPEGQVGPRAPLRFPSWVAAPGNCFVFVRCDPPPDVEVGDRIQLTAALEEVLPPRNFGQFDYRAYLVQRGTVLTGYAPSAYSLRRVSPERQWAWVWLSRLRARLMGELERHLPPEHAELAISAVYGDKITELDEDLIERFRRSGLSHILVASGTQVSLLIALLLALGWRGGHPGWMLARSALTLLVVLVYAVLAGLETSIIRALVMGVVVLAARLLRRDSDGLSSLAQAALILLMAAPLQITAAGFQLSFAATLGLIYINGITLPLIAGARTGTGGLPPLEREGWAGRVDRWWGKLRAALPEWRKAGLAALSTTIGAQLFVVPVLAAQFHQLSLWGLLSNALAVPLSFFLLVGGALLSFGLGNLPLLGPLLVWGVDRLCAALDWCARLFAAMPYSDLAVPRMEFWLVLCAYGLVFGLGEWAKLRSPANDLSAGGELEPLADERQVAWLAWGSAVCAVGIAAALAGWVLVPRQEVAALALPGSTAYIWRTRFGETWLLADPAGLTRNRNADTIESALRARGVNKLRGVVWLGPMPLRDPLPRIAGPRFDLRQPPSGDAQLGRDPLWLPASGTPQAACLAIGGSYCVVAWDAAGTLDADLAGTDGRRLVLCSAKQLTNWPPQALERLARGARLVVIDGERADPSLQVEQPGTSASYTVSGSEVRAVWRTGEIKLREPAR